MGPGIGGGIWSLIGGGVRVWCQMMISLWVSVTLDYDPLCMDWAALMATDSLLCGEVALLLLFAPSVVLQVGMPPSEVDKGPIGFCFVLSYLFI